MPSGRPQGGGLTKGKVSLTVSPLAHICSCVKVKYTITVGELLKNKCDEDGEFCCFYSQESESFGFCGSERLSRNDGEMWQNCRRVTFLHMFLGGV